MSTTPMATVAVDTLLEGAKAGDAEAWNRIVTEYGPRIRGYARARGAPDPEDVTQDVFVAAASRIGDFEGDGSAFRSWLFAIAYRQIANRHRAAAKQAAPLPETLVDPAVSPEDAVVGRFEATEAVAALDVLSDLERDVVLMRVVGELDSRAVAEAVGKRPGNVRVIQSRAMAKLRAELERRGYASAGVFAAALVADVVGPIRVAEASAIAASSAAAAESTAAAAAGTAATGGAAAAGMATLAKVAAAVTLAAVLGGGAAAITGILPDPLQSWVADAVSRVGITLPDPDGPEVTVPTVPDLPAITVPEPPDLDTPGLTLPDADGDPVDPFDPLP